MKTRRRKKSLPVMKKVFTVVELDDFEMVCRVCEAEFLDEADLKLHISQVHLNESNGKTICKICCTVLSGGEEFVSHFIFKHLENSSFCFYCYRAFSEPSLLDRHELKHCAVEENSAVTCSQCHIILVNRQELQRHEYQEHGNSDDGFMLNSYFSLLSSALNMKIMTFLDCICKKGTITCCKCKYCSINLTDYVEHLKSLKCQSLACDECCNVYKKRGSILKHMLNKPQYHGFVTRKDAQKQCLKCGNYFTLKDLSNHRNLCKIIKCLTCEQRFNSLYELTEHREQEHNIRISLETCKLCKKQFVGTLSLEKHMSRSHKNLSLYKYRCIHCDSIFIHPSKLFAHFFTQHKNIEPYTCKICNKSFRLRKQFTIHIKIVHSSVGLVEFDKNSHVIFTEKKSENTVAPEENVNMNSTADALYSDCDDATPAKKPRTKSTDKQAEHKENISTKPQDNNSNTTNSNITADENTNSNSKTISINNEPKLGTVHIEIERLKSNETKEERKSVKSKTNEKQISPEIEDSEDEPLSNVRRSLLKQKTQTPNLKRRMSMRDKKVKLTCKTCNKYCYTVQNYHHHMTLHEKTKMKRCIKCNEYFKSKKALDNHTESAHSSSKLVETLKTVLEKRKKIQPDKPCKTFKSLLERRKKMKLIMAQNTTAKKFRRTIRKVNCIDDFTATITPMSDHGLSVKNFIENFKPEVEGINISNSVTLKAVATPVNKEPIIKLRTFNPEPPPDTCNKLRFPVKFKDPPVSYMDTKINVKLVQQLVTKPSAVNMCYNEKIPLIQEKSESNDYCNMFADATDYTQYKSESIPEVAHEVLLEDLADIPRTRRLAQEVMIPKISEEHGGVRIGHLLPQAPFFKIVKVKQLLNTGCDEETDPVPNKEVTLPDGTRLVSVKNPYSHLIPNELLKEILKANKSKYYTPKNKNIEKAIAKALNEVKPSLKKGRRKKTQIES